MAATRFPIEGGHVLLFARSIGDPNPVYADEDSDAARSVGGRLAPPTFVMASAQFDPDYPLRPRIGQPWFGSGRTPSGLQAGTARPATEDADNAEDDTDDPGEDSPGTAGDDAKPERKSGGGGGGGLHAEQHFEYHRTLRVGDVLSATTRPGERWEKQGRRAGKLVFAESVTEYRNQDGDLVVTARSVGVRTERPAED